jgi:hypothetical protein
MRLRRALGSGVAALVAALALAGGSGAETGPVSVSADRAQISVRLGRPFAFRTTITNPAATETEALIAHLNILSLREGTYVDPEDWSAQRTWYLGTIPAGGSRTITWNLKAVGSGSFGVYVAVLPQESPVEPPTTSPTVQVAVEERKLLNSGGILPLVLGIPAAVGLLAVGVRLRRGR